MRDLVVFLDDGGVMSDNRRRGSQWQQLVGAFFAPRLGGAATAWARANRVVASALLESGAWQTRLAAASDYPAFEQAYLLDWVAEMCRLVGVPRPSQEYALQLARAAEAWITAQVDAAVPGTVETIRHLHAQGYMLHTASGEPSTHLHNYLTRMGVRACFGRLYGPDLIDTFKASPAYYERLLADAGVAATAAVVVDDSPAALAWAAEAGARTVRVGAPASDGRAMAGCITSLSGLPALLAQLEAEPR